MRETTTARSTARSSDAGGAKVAGDERADDGTAASPPPPSLGALAAMLQSSADSVPAPTSESVRALAPRLLPNSLLIASCRLRLLSVHQERERELARERRKAERLRAALRDAEDERERDAELQRGVALRSALGQLFRVWRSAWRVSVCRFACYPFVSARRACAICRRMTILQVSMLPLVRARAARSITARTTRWQHTVSVDPLSL